MCWSKHRRGGDVCLTEQYFLVKKVQIAVKKKQVSKYVLPMMPIGPNSGKNGSYSVL